MTAAELLAKLARLGVILSNNAGRLKVRAPQGVLSEELRDALTEHKPALLAALKPQPEAGSVSPEEPAGLQVPLADMGAWLVENGLRVVGGDPDLYGHPWRPRIFLARGPDDASGN